MGFQRKYSVNFEIEGVNKLDGLSYAFRAYLLEKSAKIASENSRGNVHEEDVTQAYGFFKQNLPDLTHYIPKD